MGDVVVFHATIWFQVAGSAPVELLANNHSALLHEPTTLRKLALFRPRVGAEWFCESLDFADSDQAAVDIAAAILGAMRPVTQ